MKVIKVIMVFIVLLFVAYGMAALIEKARGRELVIASTYGDVKDIKRSGEKLTATGKALDANGMEAAHRTLPLGTRVTLTHGHRKVVVLISDRGPFIKGRTLDLTPAANKYLRCGGLCRIRMEPWPPLPVPRPPIRVVEDAIEWGEK